MLIEIGNSYSKLSGMTATTEKELGSELSYLVGGSSSYFSGGFGPKRRSLLSKRGEFPTGLLHVVSKYLDKKNKSFSVTDVRVKPSKKVEFKIKNAIAPYQSQLDAASDCVTFERGIVQMPTGTGKSLVAQLIVEMLSVRTLIVVPSLGIRDQLRLSFREVFGDTKHILIENIDSKALQSAADYDCLIIDEAHHAASRTYHKLNKSVWKNIYYRFCLTATPFRNDNEETLLFKSICGEVIYKLDHKTAVDNGYIVPLEAYYYELPKIEAKGYTWAEIYSELVVKNDFRNQRIAELLIYLNASGSSTLCLVKEIDHGNRLGSISGVLFANGQDSSTRDFIQLFNSGKIKALIGTTGVVGEGIDTKPAEYVIIAGLGKAKSAFMQQVGRVLRKYPGKESGKVILIKDNSHKFTKRHFAEQVKFLRDEYNISPQKLEL